jgi:DNA helicase HerA-like ATPase
MPAPLLIAKNQKAELHLLPALANRHGLITGATGTGKTVTLQSIAQQLSSIGVPVFMADVKGDLAGLAQSRRR